MSDAAPTILCRPYLLRFDSLNERLAAFNHDVRMAVEDLPPEPLPSDERLAQQQFLECLDAMSWREHGDAHTAARALFDRLFWSWRGEELRIVELDTIPFALDSAWSEPTTAMFAELWRQLAPVFNELREPFDRALANGELVGRFEDFNRYAHAWGDMLERAADEELGLVVVQFDRAE